MDKHFICLANSYKRGGRCIAGIEVSIDNDQWAVLCRSDGSPCWIRPIDRNTEYGEITEGDARFIPMFSVVKLTNVEPCPHQAHSEDVFFSQMSPVGMIHPSDEVLRSFEDKAHQEIFYSTDLGISPEVYAQGDYSLMLIHPGRFHFVEDPTKNRAKYRMTFLFHGVSYDFSVTDPTFYDLIAQHPDTIETLNDLYLTLSIGLEYEGRHHKLIAGVILPSDNLQAVNSHVIIHEGDLQQITSRPFTKAEIKTCKRAFVVPSQEGLSVCIKMKSGAEEFILLDAECEAAPWQTVNLKKSLQIVYQDAMGREKKRLRLIEPERASLWKRLWKLMK